MFQGAAISSMFRASANSFPSYFSISKDHLQVMR